MEAINWFHFSKPSGYGSRIIRAERPDIYSNDMCIDSENKLFSAEQSSVHGCIVAPLKQALSSEYVADDTDNPIIKEAAQELYELWPEMADQMGQLVTYFYPVRKEPRQPYHGRWGCVCGQNYDSDPGSLYASTFGAGGLMEGWVHETGHLKLHLLGVHLETWDSRFLLNTPDELYVSPIRKDKPRPMGAVLQAFFSYLHVTEINVRAADMGDPTAVAPMLVNRNRTIEGLSTISGNIRFTDAGQDLWYGMEFWANELIERTEKYVGRDKAE